MSRRDFESLSRGKTSGTSPNDPSSDPLDASDLVIEEFDSQPGGRGSAVLAFPLTTRAAELASVTDSVDAAFDLMMEDPSPRFDESTAAERTIVAPLGLPPPLVATPSVPPFALAPPAFPGPLSLPALAPRKTPSGALPVPTRNTLPPNRTIPPTGRAAAPAARTTLPPGRVSGSTIRELPVPPADAPSDPTLDRLADHRSPLLIASGPPALGGTLDVISIIDIFQLLALGGHTGSLVARQSGGEIQVTLVRGKIAAVSSRDLRALWLLSPPPADAHLEADESEFAPRLEDGPDAARGYIPELTYRLMLWETGSFEYRTGSLRAELADTIAQVEIENLLLNGVQFLDEWHQVESVMPSLDGVPFVRRGKRPSAASMDAQAKAVFEAVDGERTFFDIARCVGMGTYATGKILFQFVTVGALGVQRSPTASPGVPETTQLRRFKEYPRLARLNSEWMPRRGRWLGPVLAACAFLLGIGVALEMNGTPETPVNGTIFSAESGESSTAAPVAGPVAERGAPPRPVETIPAAPVATLDDPTGLKAAGIPVAPMPPMPSLSTSVAASVAAVRRPPVVSEDTPPPVGKAKAGPRPLAVREARGAAPPTDAAVGQGGADETQEVEIASVPPGASILINGAQAGATPMSIAIPRSAKLVISIRKDGFKEETVKWSAASPRTFRFNLVASAP